MFTKIYWIERFENGAAIGIMPRPRGNDWLEDEIGRLKFNEIQAIISLLEKPEIYELGLENMETFCLNHKIDFINFPIQDRGLPTNRQAANELIGGLRKRLEQGEKIVIHCRMGIGRSSTIAGAVLMKDGVRVDDVLDKISKIRELKVPDTEEQINWLKQFEK